MELETILIAIIVSLSCSLCGVFLVLRRMSLMSDAISHSILLGIVLGYFLSKSLSSSVPVIGAVFAGMASVLFTELLQKTRLVKSDAAIGLVFPAMFSAGVILVSLYAGNVHLDIDAVLLGEIGLAPLDRIMFFGVSVPRSMVSMGAVLLLNLVFLTLFFKELKISTFDPGLSKSLGFSPTLINYGLMLAVSITCVGSFDSVGAVLVIALMITPSAAALLLTDDLLTMLILAGLLASLSAISGFFVAVKIDGSIAGAMAAMTGVIFCIVYLFSPKHGFIRRRLSVQKLRMDFWLSMLSVHLFTHQGTAEERNECTEQHLVDRLNWTNRKARLIVATAQKRGLVQNKDGLLILSEKGDALARKAITEI
ncbi:metal ABC transporter permease [Treponema phagedenis]|nr:metal ABC transporter permease [Treponema phagedenis]NVP24820.1 metal ABC transporter permease [Treponema phagedenis]QEJ96414.1 metal ABC transporter permease [Treponema phagedenis]QEJ99675.1 metal ABC transporter permease [Treponema phagedenis]QEK02300.1 metal ABC transporter permease [Treponema phagedenis]QEK05225.1 metal ABC transporter permease [Treponema phagedenis]